MGAKDWFICYADSDVATVQSTHPQLDCGATEAFVRRLFPDQDVVAIDDGTLGGERRPGRRERLRRRVAGRFHRVHVASGARPGDFPATDDGDYPLPFHPLELSGAAVENLFGFVFEGHSGMGDNDLVDPFDIALAGFRLTGSRKRGFFRR